MSSNIKYILDMKTFKIIITKLIFLEELNEIEIEYSCEGTPDLSETEIKKYLTNLCNDIINEFINNEQNVKNS